jgi:hypothetical protein
MAQTWNFPTYRSPGSYNPGYDGDPYYTNAGDCSAWNDTGSITIIGAFMRAPGGAFSGHAQNTLGTASAWPPLFTITWKGAGDATYGFRTGHWSGGPQDRPFSWYFYDGVDYDGSSHIEPSEMIAAGIQPEGKMLQFALSVNGATGQVVLWINGVKLRDTIGTAPGSQNLHGNAVAARMSFNCYGNWNTDLWSTNGQGNETIWGPLAVHDDFIDLSDPAVYARIFDNNGDLICPGQDGADWLNGTVPFYYSEVGVPYFGNQGAQAMTWNRVATSSYTRWGYPCGSKHDWPADMSPQFSLAKDLPGIKGVWDISGFHDPQQYFLHNPFLTGGHLKRYNTTYGGYPAPPIREGATGAHGVYFSTTGQGGYFDYNNVLDGLAANASQLYMTVCFDLSQEPTANFGFQKVVGWRSASSNSVFGVYTTYPAGNSRDMILQWKMGDNVARYTGLSPIPANTRAFVVTWAFNAGVLKVYKQNAIHSTTDLSGTGTTLHNTSAPFGIFDHTSAPSGSIKASWDFLAIGNGAPTDTEILDLHAALLDGAF